MDLVLAEPAEIALRTLEQDDRRRVNALCDALKNWENDATIRSRSKLLAGDDGTYVLDTSTDICIFFTFDQGRIVVLDIARRSSLALFAHASVPDSP
jgi:hypothetical protein